MKKVIFAVSMAVAVSAFVAFTACSNDDEVVESTSDSEYIDVVVEKIASDSDIADSLRGFLSDGNVLSRATVENEWNFDEIEGISDPEKDLYTYMIPSNENADRIAGGISRENGEIEGFFYFEKNGEYYTLTDDEGTPIFDVEFNVETGQFRYVKVYEEETMSRGKRPKVAGVHELCVAGVTALGWLTGVVAAPTTLGTSFAMSLAFSAMSDVVCEDY